MDKALRIKSQGSPVSRRRHTRPDPKGAAVSGRFGGAMYTKYTFIIP